jgi:hypothetical protein
MLHGTAAIYLDDDEHRTSGRRAANFVASVRAGSAKVVPVIVTNFSVSGCAINGLAGAEVGQKACIKLAGRLPLKAQIKWVAGKQAGCEFTSPISQSEIDFLLRPSARRRLFVPPERPQPRR